MIVWILHSSRGIIGVRASDSLDFGATGLAHCFWTAWVSRLAGWFLDPVSHLSLHFLRDSHSVLDLYFCRKRYVKSRLLDTHTCSLQSMVEIIRRHRQSFINNVNMEPKARVLWFRYVWSYEDQKQEVDRCRATTRTCQSRFDPARENPRQANVSDSLQRSNRRN